MWQRWRQRSSVSRGSHKQSEQAETCSLSASGSAVEKIKGGDAEERAWGCAQRGEESQVRWSWQEAQPDVRQEHKGWEEGAECKPAIQWLTRKHTTVRATLSTCEPNLYYRPTNTIVAGCLPNRRALKTMCTCHLCIVYAHNKLHHNDAIPKRPT